MPRALVLAAVVTVAACGGSSAERATTGPQTFEITGDEVQRMAATGANQAGVGLTPEQWAAFATKACRFGAWDHVIATELAGELRTLTTIPSGVTDVDLAAVVWFSALEGCRELFPPDAVELGPPMPE